MVCSSSWMATAMWLHSPAEVVGVEKDSVSPVAASPLEYLRRLTTPDEVTKSW